MKIKRFLKTAVIFLMGNMLSKLISFFLLPLYTDKINPIQFGNYDIAISFVNLIVPIAFFQIWDGMYRYAFDHNEKKYKDKMIVNSIFVYFIGIVFYVILFIAIHSFIQIEYFAYVILYGIFYGINYIQTYSARVYMQNTLFVLSGVISTLITAISNIILIIGFHMDIKSIYISLIVGSLAQFLLLELRMGIIRKFDIKLLDKKVIVTLLKFSIPLCIATVSYWLLSGLTKIYIQKLVGETANGMYAVANKFGSMITLLVSVIQFSWNETAYIMTTNESNNKNANYEKIVNFMVVGVTLGTAFIIMFVKLIFPYLISINYNDALSLIPGMLVGVSANALAGFIGTIFMAEKNNSFITTSTFCAAIFNIVSGYLLSKFFGVQGSVVALATSFILLYVLRLMKISKLLTIHLKLVSIFRAICTLILSILLFFTINSKILIIATLFGIMLVIILEFKVIIFSLVGVLKTK